MKARPTKSTRRLAGVPNKIGQGAGPTIAGDAEGYPEDPAQRCELDCVAYSVKTYRFCS